MLRSTSKHPGIVRNARPMRHVPPTKKVEFWVKGLKNSSLILLRQALLQILNIQLSTTRWWFRRIFGSLFTPKTWGNDDSQFDDCVYFIGSANNHQLVIFVQSLGKKPSYQNHIISSKTSIYKTWFSQIVISNCKYVVFFFMNPPTGHYARWILRKW